ncbi:hypothetical protein PAXRUDRAFT_137025 [Paxillus rubicundulus Ve08.2h10]|uniref:Uncharacterized protein n=1 Tax=Paxillus rubicundulus Ve08.2h10 TaxID=930991 RepID=A0A0D0EB34_9AGAM|nr:hypothetical protein PAXRUDRAFT_137025 [Paxillus rubicundulus Ve08.2h10]
MGISISVDAVHATVQSLSVESLHAIQSLGQTLLTGYAYNNSNIDLKTTNHIVENLTDTLNHLYKLN